MTRLATIEDVKRKMGALDQDIDDLIRPCLEEAEEYVRNYCRNDFGTGEVTETFTQIRQDGILDLRDTNPTDISVLAYGSTNDDAIPFMLTDELDWQHLGNGRILLLFPKIQVVPGFTEAVGRYQPGVYQKVTVTYTGLGNVPATVRENTALIAAVKYSEAAGIISGITSERLGDYSYSTGSVSSEGIPLQAIRALRQYRRTTVVST